MTPALRRKIRERCQVEPWALFAWLITYNREGKIAPFPELEYLAWMVADLHGNRMNLWLKSRQMMATWVVAGYILWMMLFHPRTECLILCKKQEDSAGFGERIKFLNRHLPDFLRGQIRKENISVLQLDNDAGVKFLPATPEAARSSQAKFMALDEFGHQEGARQIWTAAKPALQDVGHSVVFSSPNGTSGKGRKFYELWDGAEQFGFKRRVIHYGLDPAKDAAWVEREKKGFSDDEWNQEYECQFVGFAGRVYPEFRRDIHEVDLPPLRADGRFYAGIDFGFANPFVYILVYCPPPDFAEYYVIGEHYRKGMLLSDHAAAIEQVHKRASGLKWAGEVRTVELFTPGIADPEEAQARAELSRMGVPTIGASKPPGSVRRGIEIKKRLLKVDPKTKRPRLMIGRGLAPNTCKEFENYRERENRDGKNADERPHEDNDHAMDALRYIIYKLENNKTTQETPEFTW